MEHQWEVMRFGRKKKKACGSSDFGLDINLRGLLQLSGRAPQTGGLAGASSASPPTKLLADTPACFPCFSTNLGPVVFAVHAGTGNTAKYHFKASFLLANISSPSDSICDSACSSVYDTVRRGTPGLHSPPPQHPPCFLPSPTAMLRQVPCKSLRFLFETTT